MVVHACRLVAGKRGWIVFMNLMPAVSLEQEFMPRIVAPPDVAWGSSKHSLLRRLNLDAMRCSRCTLRLLFHCMSMMICGFVLFGGRVPLAQNPYPECAICGTATEKIHR